MARKIATYIVYFSMIFVPAFAYADTNILTTTSATSYVIRFGDTVGNPITACQSFTAVSGTVSYLKVYLAAPNGTEGDTITVGIKAADVSHHPTGSYLGYGTINQNVLTNSPTQQTFTLNVPVSVSSGTDYCVQLETTGAGGSGSPARVNAYGDTASSYPNGQASFYDGTWNDITGVANVELWESGGPTPSPTPTNDMAIPWSLSALAILTGAQGIYFSIFFMALMMIFFGVAFVFRSVFAVILP